MSSQHKSISTEIPGATERSRTSFIVGDQPTAPAARGCEDRSGSDAGMGPTLSARPLVPLDSCRTCCGAETFGPVAAIGQTCLHRIRAPKIAGSTRLRSALDVKGRPPKAGSQDAKSPPPAVAEGGLHQGLSLATSFSPGAAAGRFAAGGPGGLRGCRFFFRRFALGLRSGSGGAGAKP